MANPDQRFAGASETSVSSLPALQLRGLSRWRLPELNQVGATLLLLVVALLALYPIAVVVLQSFQSSSPGEAIAWSLAGWQALFGERGLQSAVWNTVTLTLVRQVLALVVGILVAWLLGRTNVPGRHIFEFLFWLAFFFPSLTVTLSWVFLLDPRYGLVNQLLTSAGLTSLGLGPLNIYSFWGIVWVHLVGNSLAIKVMLLTPVFRNMNSTYEDAAQVFGASKFWTMVRIFIPLMLPVIVAVEFLALLRSFEAFEIEQILGTPIRFFVASTWIYDTLSQARPRYDAVAALAVVLIGASLALVTLQRAIIGTRRYTTITGQYQARTVRLGRMRWVAFGFLILLVVLAVGVPVVCSLTATLMKKFGFFTSSPWTMQNWQTAVQDPLLVRALQNTVVLALSTAFASLVVFSLIAYVITRTQFWGRPILDYLSWLPFTVPGIILSLALLTMFLQPAARPLYGTMFTLVLSLVISGMPFVVQLMKSAFVQLSRDLEEASFVSGVTWWRTYRLIVVPLISPTLVVVGVITFIGAGRNISQVALLSNTATRPLSMLQLDYISQGNYEVAAVIATILLLLSAALALVARRYGFRGIS
ncbi:MAG: iron ABC transporter permease [Chloroflexi bacterium]|nr:iron ABC transporter permease [Chloroflexota bacterium]